MKHITKISWLCFVLIFLIEIRVAVPFLTASQIMNYHQVAMGSPWDALSTGMQAMTLNFMRVAGLGFLLTGISMLFLLIFPFRKGEYWSKWALSFLGLTQAIIMGLVVTSVRTHTPAVPPLAPFVVIGMLSIIGFVTYRGVLWPARNNTILNESNESYCEQPCP